MGRKVREYGTIDGRVERGGPGIGVIEEGMSGGTTHHSRIPW